MGAEIIERMRLKTKAADELERIAGELAALVSRFRC
jgi:hypothetical protein